MRKRLALLLALTTICSMGAEFRTPNFIVISADPQVCKSVGEWAEHYRREKAIQWLGREMPTWPDPCPLRVTVNMDGPSGETEFTFGYGRVNSQRMQIRGPLDRLIYSVLPHEITHTIFAYHFKCPVPRWADEGGSVLSEDDTERDRHDKLARSILNKGQQIPMRTLLALKEYPPQVMCLYAQGYSISDYLVKRSNKQHFLNFVGHGMQQGWDHAAKSYFGHMDEQGRLVTKTFTYPPELSAQVNAWAGGEYTVDVKQFRTDDKDFLLRQIYDMSRQHFAVVRQMMRHQPWDFFMFVEMGTDRIHHGFWKYHDTTHYKYEPGNPYANAIWDYYRYLDGELGTLLDMLDDDTAVMVVSDHGAKKMEGGICVNEWLLREGWLSLAGPRPAQITPVEKVKLDWTQTRAWGEGGYYARVFMNVQGREPQGVIPAADYERVRDELAAQLKAIRGPNGEDIGTRVYKPHALYRQVNNVAPDLIVYFGGLYWRSVGSLGHPQVWTFENDTGPDDANHAEYGIFIYSDPRRDLGGRELSGLEIMDFAPTVLRHFGLPVPADMQGRVIAL